MPALFIYLIKVNIALLVFCAGYYAVLRRLTFYTLNRAYLVTAILFATLYPRIDLSSFINQHQQIAKPVQVVVINWQAPVSQLQNSILQHDKWYWLELVFWAGVVIFAFRLLIQLLSLYKLHQRSKPMHLQHYFIRVIQGDINPFSFWRNIYLNPANHSPAELRAILEHEQVHVNQWHTFDILLGEISTVFYWFNPGVWLMKKAIKENLEFITDRKILQTGMDTKTYQYSLLNVNMNGQNNTIVNNFNISTIKKRIMMMNAKRSASINITRYLFLVPVVTALLLVFSVSRAEFTKSVTKSGATVMKALKTAVSQITITGTANTDALTDKKAGPRKNMPQLEVRSLTTIFSDTIKNKKAKADTLKNVELRLRGVTLNGNDPDIYINNVKTDQSLQAVNPDSIKSIDIIKTAAPNGAIYITTKGHQPSIQINGINIDTVKAKKTNAIGTVTITSQGHSAASAGGRNEVVVQGYATPGKSSHTAKEEVVVQGYATPVKSSQAAKVEVVVKGYKTPVKSSQAAKVVVVTGYGTNTTRIFTDSAVFATAKPNTGKGIQHYAITYDDSAREVKGNPAVHDVVVRGYKIDNVKRVNGTSISINPKYAFTRDIIDGKANNVVVIDGRVADQKDLKKLSFDNINSLSIMEGDSAIQAYGSKAKNGVIVITTKKAAAKKK